MSDEQRAAIYLEIDFERARQDEQWGGPEHDDQQVPPCWEMFIHRQSARAGEERRENAMWLWPRITRARLVKIAALAIAGVESIDRRATTDAGPRGRTDE